MAQEQLSTAPLFTTLQDRWAELTEDSGTDLILRKRGANQFLGDDAAHHDGFVNAADSGIVGINLIKDHDVPFGAPTKGQPLGRQNL